MGDNRSASSSVTEARADFSRNDIIVAEIVYPHSQEGMVHIFFSHAVVGISVTFSLLL